jgi:thioredoxin-like negative regulator of GroEL
VIVAVALPQLVFFYSPRSGQSRRAEGYLAQVLQRRHNHETFSLVRVDVDAHPNLAGRFNITSTPTLLVIAEGRVCARLSELHGCREIAKVLQPWLK